METVYINSRTLFINLEIANSGVLRAMSNYDIESVIGFLRSKRIISSRFIRFELGKETEILDAIRNSGADKVVFFIREDNYELSRLVTEFIKEYDDSLAVIWFGQFVFSHHPAILDDTRCDICILFEPENTMLELIMKDRGSWREIRSVSARTGNTNVYYIDSPVENWLCDSPYSPYESSDFLYTRLSEVEIPLERLSYRADLDKVARSFISPENVIRELEAVSRACWIPGQAIVLRCENIASLPYFDELMDILGRKFSNLIFKVSVDLGHISAETLARLADASCTHVDMIVRRPCGAETLRLFGNYLQKAGLTLKLTLYLTEENEKECIQFLRTVREEKLVSPENIRIISDRTVQSPRLFPRRNLLPRELLPAVGMDELAERHAPLLRNLIMFMEGRDEVNSNKGYASFVRLPENTIDHRVLLSLKPYIGPDTALIIERSPYSAKEDEGVLFTERAGVISRLDRQYDIYREQLRQAGYIGTNVCQVQKDCEGNISVRINDLYLPGEKVSKTIKYGQAYSAPADGNAILTVETPEDFEALEKNIKYHIATGKFRNDYELTCSIKDPCRWTGPEYCRLARMTSLRIDGEGNVIPCGGCTESLGNILSSRINLRDEALRIIKREEKKRNCGNCQMKSCCSKCALLPDGIDSRLYCDLMKSSEYVRYYFKILFLMKNIFHDSRHFSGVGHGDVKVSGPYSSHYLPAGIAEAGGESHIYPFIYMFSVREQPYLFNSAQNSLVRLNHNAAFIIEALFRGVGMELIKSAISDHFSIPMPDAEGTLRSALTSLRSMGYLKSHADV